jgi:integrase
MPTAIPTIKRHPNKKYYLHWTERGRSKRTSTGSTVLAEAKAFLAEWMTMEHEDHAAVVTCADAWAVFDKRHQARDKAAWRRLEPVFGSMKIAAVSDATIADYVAKRVGQGAAHGTVWLETTRLLASWHYAVKQKLMPLSGLPALTRLRPPPPRKRWLTLAEIDRLLAAAAAKRGPDGRMSRGERFILLGLETAARRRAIETLRWDAVDWERGVVDYTAGWANPRSKKKRAVVPISARLLPLLRQMHAERIGDFVLDNDRRVLNVITAIAASAGLSGVTPHTLRHSAATHMARNNVSYGKIAKLLGNTVAMVEEVYAHHDQDDLREALDAMQNRRTAAA